MKTTEKSPKLPDSQGIAIEEIANDLKNLNINSLIAKGMESREIWNANALGDNAKKARRKLRGEQLSLCKSLLHSILTKQNAKTISAHAQALTVFNQANLRDSKNYTRVSIKESPEKRGILDKGYNALARLTQE